MPILQPETNLYPDNLLEGCLWDRGHEDAPTWWALYTLVRREKELMRRLRKAEIPFYCPIFPKRYRSPAGRIRTSYMPLFSNYVFIVGDEHQRYEAVSTGCVSRHLPVADGAELARDLRQIRGVITAGVPILRESRIKKGARIRVRSGKFRGYEGFVVRREGETRLIVHVNFLQQGCSIVLDECEIEPTEWARSA